MVSSQNTKRENKTLMTEVSDQLRIIYERKYSTGDNSKKINK